MAQSLDVPSSNFLTAFEAPLTERQVFLRKVYGLFTATIAVAGLAAYAVAQHVPATLFAARHWYLWLLAWYGLQFLEAPLARTGRAGGYVLLIGFAGVTAMFAGPLIRVYAAADGLPLVAGAFGLASFTFLGLTAYVLVRREDFSWMGGALSMACFASVGLAVLALFVPFSEPLSLLFAAGMVVLMAGVILYETSAILHHYRVDQAPLAAARLFTAFFVLFLNLLRLLSRGRN